MAEEENSQTAPVEPTASEGVENSVPVPVETPKVEEATSASIETPTAQPEPPTAQMGRNEPLPEQGEPLASSAPSSGEPQPPAPETQTQPQPAVAAQPVSSPTPNVRDLATKARAVIQTRKRTKLEKILEELTKRGTITNDEVEKLLHVSDATATRYLQQLEKEGKIQQVGTTGHAVKYQKL